MTAEHNYDFLERMRIIHKPGRFTSPLPPDGNELLIDSRWSIVILPEADSLVRRAAEDLQDYLFSSMNVSVALFMRVQGQPGPRTILLKTADAADSALRGIRRLSCHWEAGSEKGIVLCGDNSRSLFHACIHLEDLMNLREAPILQTGAFHFAPLPRMRSVHSGSGIDDFPDWQLNAIAHAGFTAIDLFIRKPDQTACSCQNVNDIIKRADSFGLDVVLYSYLNSFKHPDDQDADEFFDSIYGEIFRRHPGAAAIHLVGESLEFPSRDPRTSGKLCYECTDGIPEALPAPGWYPCSDYPDYVKKVADAVHKAQPEAEVILNTYNWGYVALEERRRLLNDLPRNITIQATYDIFKEDIREDARCPIMDYSICAAEPSFYFTSEMETAAELGFRNMRVTSNLSGVSWDFGAVPYVPVPFRWARRMQILKHYLLKYGVNSFYENHHNGWWPNQCNDLAKAVFADSGDIDIPAFIKQLAVRDYGAGAADSVIRTWELWSRAMDHYTGSNEDQYGPWRTGPSYPFIFQPNISRTMEDKAIRFPTDPNTLTGYRIIMTLYTPYENSCQTPAPLRFPVEIRELKKMLKLWQEGLDLLGTTLKLMPENKKQDGIFLHALGKYILNSIKTTIHIKQWWILNQMLQVPSDRKNMLDILVRLEELAEKEIDNVKDTFEPVQTDSRLGWEPSMGYVCDAWHLEWKLRQMKHSLREIGEYRNMIMLQ